LALQGKVERGFEIYALASHYPFVANSHWHKDIVEKRIVAVAATLPAGVVAEARERGSARDPWDMAAELLVELGE
jgi:hypothetical protein